MAKNIFKGKIDKTVNWGGDNISVNEETGVGSHSNSGEHYDSVSGERVQEFIKNQLEGKWGVIHKGDDGYYRAFADQASYEDYRDNGNQDAVLGEFEAYSNYRGVIELVDTPQMVSVLSGTTNNIIKVRMATFTNSDDNSFVPEMIKVTYTITRPDGTSTKITHNVPAKINDYSTDELLIDDYIVNGENTISINTIGSNTNAVATTSLIYNIIILSVTDDIKIENVHTFTEEDSYIELPIHWSISGLKNSTKGIEVLVFGGDTMATLPGTIGNTRESGDLEATARFTPTSKAHTIIYRGYLDLDGQKYYTPWYYRSVICYKDGSDPIISMALEAPYDIDPTAFYNTPSVYGMSQYSKFTLPLAIYNDGVSSTNAEILLIQNGEVKDSYYPDFVNGVRNDVSMTPNFSGNAKIQVLVDGVLIKELDVVIDAINWDIEEDNTNLLFDFSANGKVNGAHQEEWVSVRGSNSFEAKFEGFTWDNNSGWYKDRLVIARNNVLKIVRTGETNAFNPLNDANVGNDGFTLEIEFQAINVSDDDAVLWDMKDDNTGAGIRLTASRAIFSDNGGKEVSTYFKSGEDIRIAFVINPNTNGTRCIYLYVNGALCGAVQYTSQSLFSSTKGLTFMGTRNAEMKLKQLRAYKKALSSGGIVDNFILYRDTAEEKKYYYDRNNILNGGVYNIEKLKGMMPIMLLTNMEEYNPDASKSTQQNNLEFLMNLEKDGAKIGGFSTKKVPALFKELEFINPGDPLTNFKVHYPQLSCQGTSSMAYPVKNLRIYLKNKNKNDDGDPVFFLKVNGVDTPWPQPYIDAEYNPSGNNKTLIKVGESNKGKGKIGFKSGEIGTSSEGCKSQPVNCWCLKADYAESSSSHNTGVARIWNNVMKNAAINGVRVSQTYAQRRAFENNYTYDVRTTIDGFPIMLFYRTSDTATTWSFVGKFNFNNDKSTESVFGFCDIPGVEYQEYSYFDGNNFFEITEGEYNAHPLDNAQISLDITDKTLEEMESLTNKDFYDIVQSTENIAHYPTPYEYSKTYWKLNVLMNGSPFKTVYHKKEKTSGETSVKNYCIEILENNLALTLFNAVESDFYDNWEKAWEFRYPEGTTDTETQGGLRNFKEFYDWLHSTMVNKKVNCVLDENNEYVKAEEGTVECIECPISGGKVKYVPINDFFAPGSEWNETITITQGIINNGDIVHNSKNNKTFHVVTSETPSNYEEYVSLKRAKFEREKWDHLDIFKMAAYYSYLMRFGAVDQVVKNAMFMTEGGTSYVYRGKNIQSVTTSNCKWFFINYDNDTILGLNNDGKLVYSPDIDRQTRDGAGYAYAGHESVLWNNLEADEEFMSIVPEVDKALYTAGLTYEEVINIFNDEQADRWSERTINDDAENKYLQDSKKRAHIEKLQGPRSSHRSWWISKRFALLDSLYVSGAYDLNQLRLKTVGYPSDTFTVLPTEMMNYGWKAGSFSQSIRAEKDEFGNFKPVQFSVGGGGAQQLSVSDDLNIYGVAYVSEIDLSCFAKGLQTLNLTNSSTKVLGTRIKSLILGNDTDNNGSVNDEQGNASILREIAGLNVLTLLENVDIRGFAGLTTLDFSKNVNLKTVRAFRSGLQSLVLPEGTRIERMEVPATFNQLVLDGANYLTLENLVFENNNYASLSVIKISNSQLFDSWSLLKKWYNDRNGELYGNDNIVLNDINWVISENDLDIIEAIKNSDAQFALRGNITVLNNTQSTTTRDELVLLINRLQRLFGAECLNKSANPEVYVSFAIPFVVLNSNTIEINAGEEISFVANVYPELSQTGIFNFGIIENGSDVGIESSGVTLSNSEIRVTDIDATYGILLTTKETAFTEDRAVRIQSSYRSYESGARSTSYIDVIIKAPVYPVVSSSRIDGKVSLYNLNNEVYDLVLSNTTGSYNVTWRLTGESGYEGYCSGEQVSKNEYRVDVSGSPETSVAIILTATVSPVYPNTFASFTLAKNILILNDDVILTSVSNLTMMAVARSAGWTSDANVLKRQDVTGITGNGLKLAITTFSPYPTEGFNFNELTEFTAVTSLEEYTFSGTTIKEITIPSRITTLGNGLFQGCEKLDNVVFESGSTISLIPNDCFRGCNALDTIKLPDSVTRIGERAFAVGKNDANGFSRMLINHSGLQASKGDIIIPNTLQSIGTGAFGFETVSANISYFGLNRKIETIELPDSLTIDVDRWLMKGKRVKEFKCSENSVNYSVENGVLYNKDKTKLIKYPPMKNGTATTYVLPDSVIILGDRAFQYSKLQEIVFNSNTLTCLEVFNTSSIDEDGHYLFNGSDRLRSIDMGDSTIEEFGAYTFEGCNLLSEIIWPKGLKRIGQMSFGGCNAITEIILPDTVEQVIYSNSGDRKNTDLVVVNDDGKQITVSLYGFSSMEKLKTLHLSRNFDLSNSRVFYSLPALEEVMFPLFSYEENGVSVYNEPSYWPNDPGAFISNSLFNSQRYEKLVRFLPYNKNGVVDDQKLIKISDNIIYQVGEIVETENGKRVVEREEVQLIRVAPGDTSNTATYIENPPISGFSSFSFYGSFIKDIDIPESVMGVGDQSFYYGGGNSVTFPSTIERIPSMAFVSSDYKKLVFKSRTLSFAEIRSLTEVNKLNDITLYHVGETAPKLVVARSNATQVSFGNNGSIAVGKMVFRIPYCMAEYDPEEGRGFVPSYSKNKYLHYKPRLTKIVDGVEVEITYDELPVYNTSTDNMATQVNYPYSLWSWGLLGEDYTKKIVVDDEEKSYWEQYHIETPFTYVSSDIRTYLSGERNGIKTKPYQIEWITFLPENDILIKFPNGMFDNTPYIETVAYTYTDNCTSSTTATTSNDPIPGVLEESGDFEGYYRFRNCPKLIDYYPYQIKNGPGGSPVATVTLKADQLVYEDLDVAPISGGRRLLSSPKSSSEPSITIDDYYILKNEINRLKDVIKNL